MNKRTQYTGEYKASVVLRVLHEEETVAEIAAAEGLNPVMISRWRSEFLERAAMVFGRKPTEAERELASEKERTADLERKVGQLTIENDWLKKNLQKLPPDVRKSLVERHKALSLAKQTGLLEIGRTSIYKRPTRTSNFSLIGGWRGYSGGYQLINLCQSNK